MVVGVVVVIAVAVGIAVGFENEDVLEAEVEELEIPEE